MWAAATSFNPHAFYSSSRRVTLEKNYSIIYKYLAHYIRIQGLQRTPTRSQPERNALRHRFAEDQAHFQALHPNSIPLGLSLLTLLHANLLLSKETESYLSSRYQSIVARTGQALAGDEKLFEFRGKSGWQRMKHDKLGLWSYQCCGMLSTGLPYLVHVRSHSVDSGLGETVPTVEVMQAWGEVIKQLQGRCNTLLVADSYYLDQTSFMLLRNLEVPYICAVQACRFQYLADEVRKHAKKPGKTALLYNADEHETFCHHWYADSRIGKKYVMANCLVPQMGVTPKKWVPGCDDFTEFFNYCDHFNNGLVDKLFPHRSSSDSLALHDFHFSSLLLQTYYTYLTLNHLSQETVSYQNAMVNLADQLYEYGLVMY
jgi:hypothetical protein